MKKLLIVFGIIMVVAVLLAMEIYTDNDDMAVNLNITNIKDAIPKVALTFDDGPSGQYTEKLLDGLKERGVKATFFVMGKSANDNKKIIKRMYNEGHLIGNHTYTHADLAKSDYKIACKEISDTNTCISDITGYTPRFIRPPYGDWNDKLLSETDMSVVLWTVDPEDWKDQNADIVASRVLKSVNPGDIILLHDIFNTSVEAAFKIIDKLKDKGYYFVTIDKINSSKIISRKEKESIVK